MSPIRGDTGTISIRFLLALSKYPKKTFTAMEFAYDNRFPTSTVYNGFYRLEKEGWMQAVGKIHSTYGKFATLWTMRMRLNLIPIEFDPEIDAQDKLIYPLILNGFSDFR